ncbi:hypothetical protein [Aestuariivirga sp.]|uniref:hypothetical protein n=1 Tax=Aestuariivirga sp. TaxID=2650926 RepID=UPI0035B302FB
MKVEDEAGNCRLPAIKTPTMAATVAGGFSREVLQQLSYPTPRKSSRAPLISWTIDGNLFVVAYAMADRVLA